MLTTDATTFRLRHSLAVIFLTFHTTPSGVFCLELPWKTGCAESPVRYERAAIVPSASTLSKTDLFWSRIKYRRSRGRRQHGRGHPADRGREKLRFIGSSWSLRSGRKRPHSWSGVIAFGHSLGFGRNWVRLAEERRPCQM